MAHRKRRTYDHRVKAQIIAAGNPHLFPELQIPLSTSRSWIRRGVGAVVTFDAPLEGEAQLRDHAKVYMDAGVENLNKDVNALFSGSALERIIAQVDASFCGQEVRRCARVLQTHSARLAS